MTLQGLIKKLEQSPGYLKSGPGVVAKRFKVSLATAVSAIKAVKNGTFTVDNENKNVITEFDDYVKKNGIEESQVHSVKYWQNMKGEQRFSVVTKNGRTEDEIKESIEEFAKLYSPKAHKRIKPKIRPLRSKVALEISLPDIHYGKLTDISLEAMEKQFIETIEDLLHKAEGLNIQRIILPIGNDGMNTDGMKMTTTRGTPQHDVVGWKDSFRGYWTLIVYAVEILKSIADVDIIVVPGNHDYERMFYAGDVLKGWFRNDPNVTVDNSTLPRKYYRYGANMIMFTHGDNEKPTDMPLIMATEQPEMFAKCTSREAHCGHFHKEQVNEYRGVKVRFLPSICAPDEWHKKMGYESFRTAQAFIWNYEDGLEGYLQSNVK